MLIRQCDRCKAMAPDCKNIIKTFYFGEPMDKQHMKSERKHDLCEECQEAILKEFNADARHATTQA